MKVCAFHCILFDQWVSQHQHQDQDSSKGCNHCNHSNRFETPV